MFRVFGSPFTLVLHQHVTYLRIKQLPFKVYCTSLTTTLFYGLVYGARNAFCCLTPNGSSRLQVWQLAESAELDEDLLTATAKHGQDGEVKYVSADGKPLFHTQRILVNKRTHPQLHLATWATVLYACWWLAKTGAMYRWVLGEGLDVVEGYLRYFTLAAIPGLNMARAMGPKFREVMSRLTMVTGVSRETAPYMEEHFHRMCKALEYHFSQQGPDVVFLLGTPHPTLADVTLGAAFSSSFLTDDPPAAVITESYPHLVEYVERVTGWKGGVFVGEKVPFTGERKSESAKGGNGAVSPEEGNQSPNQDDYPDVVPETLSAFFAILSEVFPFMMSQCASFNAYMSSDAIRTLKREALEAPWEGCHGYLLPQMTSIKSLMIVDNSVSSVQARAQDLEVAFLAAQEVMDEELCDFGRDAAQKSPAAAAGDEAAALPEPSPVPSSGEKESKAREMLARAAATEAKEGGGSDDTAALQAVPEARETAEARRGGAAAVTEDEDDLSGLRTRRRGNMILNKPTDINDADDADFYRVFTKKGLRQFGSVTLHRSSIAERRARDGSGEAVVRDASGKAVAVGGPTVYDHLKVLRDMLAKMRSPQYTLTSVFHGRRMYVAVIPEYEVAKRRAKHAAEKRSASSVRHAAP